MTLWAIINHGTKVSHAMTMVHHIRVPLWQLAFNFSFFIVSFAFLLYSFSMYVPKIVLVELFISSCHLSLSLCTLSPTHVLFVSLPCSLYLFLFLSSYFYFSHVFFSFLDLLASYYPSFHLVTLFLYVGVVQDGMWHCKMCQINIVN